MAADFTIKQNDVLPVLDDSLTYTDGSEVNLTGATLAFVMRSLTAPAPVTLTGEAEVTNETEGLVSYTFSAADTSTAGEYMGLWVVTFAGGEVQSFPTTGYVSIAVEANLYSGTSQQIVSLAEVKDYLNILPEDRNHDNKLVYFVNSATPIAEDICGPVRVQTFNEWYDGGQYFFVLRHRPAISIVSCDIYIGPIQYNCSLVGNPVPGSIYSVMLEPDGRRVVRRGPGGGVIPFPNMLQSIHCIYTAGRTNTEWSIRHGVLELIRLNYEMSQQMGGLAAAMTDEEAPAGPKVGFYVPGRVRELFGPRKRFPRIA